jgi:hypothetical protein
MLLECIQKFVEDFIFCLFTADNIRVLLGIVSSLNIADVNLTRAIFVHDFECLHAKLLS